MGREGLRLHKIERRQTVYGHNLEYSCLWGHSLRTKDDGCANEYP